VPAPPSCFAAIVLPPTPPVAALQDRLPPELRPIHPEDMHLTVAYFGRIDPARHAPLLAALAEVDFDGADAVLGSVLPLPSREHPTAITLTLEPGDDRATLVRMMAEQRRCLAEIAGTEPETRTPLPHVTFARPRGRRMTPDKATAILGWADAVAPLACAVRLGALVLMRSRPPRESGPYYEIVEPGAVNSA